MANNTTIIKFDATQNIVKPQLLEEIAFACQRNVDVQKINKIPDYKQELKNLLTITNNGRNCTLDKRESLKQVFERVRQERE